MVLPSIQSLFDSHGYLMAVMAVLGSSESLTVFYTLLRMLTGLHLPVLTTCLAVSPVMYDCPCVPLNTYPFDLQ